MTPTRSTNRGRFLPLPLPRLRLGLPAPASSPTYPPPPLLPAPSGLLPRQIGAALPKGAAGRYLDPVRFFPHPLPEGR
jgi:hypothetical protein